MRKFHLTVLAAIALAVVACGDSTGPSDGILATRLTFDDAGTANASMAFDVTTIPDSLGVGDAVAIDVLVEDSTKSGWVRSPAGRSVSLFLDDDFRAFDQIETNTSGHALLTWHVPSRDQVSAGPHIITARLAVPSTGVQLTPDSIRFGVLGPDTSAMLVVRLPDGGNTLTAPAGTVPLIDVEPRLLISVDGVVVDSAQRAGGVDQAFSIGQVGEGCTTIPPGDFSYTRLVCDANVSALVELTVSADQFLWWQMSGGTVVPANVIADVTEAGPASMFLTVSTQ